MSSPTTSGSAPLTEQRTTALPARPSSKEVCHMSTIARLLNHVATIVRNKGASSRKRRRRGPSGLRAHSFRPWVESLETRLVLNVGGLVSGGGQGVILHANPSVPQAWFQENLSDPNVEAVAWKDFARDNALTRDDMLDIFAAVGANGTVTSADM